MDYDVALYGALYPEALIAFEKALSKDVAAAFHFRQERGDYSAFGSK
jgi:hypothetical protein